MVGTIFTGDYLVDIVLVIIYLSSALGIVIMLSSVVLVIGKFFKTKWSEQWFESHKHLEKIVYLSVFLLILLLFFNFIYTKQQNNWENELVIQPVSDF